MQRERPFAALVDPDRIEPIHHPQAHSGGAFWAFGPGGERYKLRVCARPLRARRIERYLRLLPELFPPLVGREGRFLLLRVLHEHRQVTRKELLDSARRIGRLAALLRQRAEPPSPGERVARGLAVAHLRHRLHLDLRMLRGAGALDAEEAAGVLRKHRARRARFGMAIGVELDDLHKGNFMIRDADGDLRYVDEDAVGLRLRGQGLASLLKTATRRRLWRQYVAGYAEVGDASLFCPEYVEWLLLLDAIRAAARKLRTGRRLEKLPAEAEAIRLMAQTGEVVLDWRFPRG